MTICVSAYSIATNGTQKPVHHYKIESGQVNPGPMLADEFQEVPPRE